MILEALTAVELNEIERRIAAAEANGGGVSLDVRTARALFEAGKVPEGLQDDIERLTEELAEAESEVKSLREENKDAQREIETLEKHLAEARGGLKRE